jgi:hypothetical protein
VTAHTLPQAGRRQAADSKAGRAKASLAGSRPDRRRVLQLALAGTWLLDAALQFQPAMFTRALGQTLAASAMGNIALVADPIRWNAGLIQRHAVLLNALFATTQLLLAAGIVWRRTTRVALGASIVWAIGVWWLGEGLGGMLAGMASPITGAPGAAILYALLAVLLWPADRAGEPAPFTAARAVGARMARTLWAALWLVLASVALWPQNRGPQAMALQVLGAGNGEPGWLAGLDRHVAVLAAQRGLAASVVLAGVLALIGVAVWLPAPALRPALVLAIAVAAVTWVAGEAFGAILTGQGTDPSTGPLLALLALAFWPARLPAGADLGP